MSNLMAGDELMKKRKIQKNGFIALLLGIPALLGLWLVASSPAQAATAVTGISLSDTSLALNVGEGASLVATITPTNATNKTVTWSSSNSAVATVSSTSTSNNIGAVTAVANGTAIILHKMAIRRPLLR